ncbi:uncharacterized protein LOC111790279 [Cucurbita pepo subsp. pepo]|uniref:uncharacterized protein LOC111790279 n=1 Tax=Cucurbita pepo subsp. pepo TaxID=3664 RepID=UPI000C9D37A9|nr:uncharacterized protein LOC111790279 [Cucurbita pepo subsp. pepo]
MSQQVNKAIDSLRFLEDVGETDLNFLEHILPHCTVEQLMRIENCSKGRDLTPVTNKLWKTFYERKFGKDAVNSVIEMMKHKESFKWKQMYELKTKELEEKAVEIEKRYIQNCHNEKARKQSRQVKICEISPPSSKVLKKPKVQTKVCQVSSVTNNKRSYVGGTSKILKKARKETLQSIETKNAIAFRRNAVQK